MSVVSIQPNDLPVLAKIFNPNTQYLLIEKKENQVLLITDTLGCRILYFENTNQLKELLKNQTTKNCTLIQFSPTVIFSRTLTIIQIDSDKFPFDQNFVSYDFINNPDETIRWIYPTSQKRPTFLHLYNASGWKGTAIKRGIRFGFFNGFGKWIKHGSLRVYAPYAPIGDTSQNVSNLFYASDFAIFTGTKGENRKAVIAFEKNKKATHFLKVPLTQTAQALVMHEGEKLNQLRNFDLQVLVVPQAIKVHHNLLQTNIRPTTTLPNLKLTATHLHGLHELYLATLQEQALKNTPIWEEVEQDLSTLVRPQIANRLSLSTIVRIEQQLLTLKEQLDTSTSIPMALAHGDFTPWNTHLSAKQVMVYDWELAIQSPLLYDAFHFIFQTNILVKRLSFSDIKKQIEQLKKHATIQFWLTKFDFSFEETYRFYLLRTVSYYASRYIRQTHLHEQAHWLLETWTDALSDLTLEAYVQKSEVRPSI